VVPKFILKQIISVLRKDCVTQLSTYDLMKCLDRKVFPYIKMNVTGNNSYSIKMKQQQRLE